MNKSICIAVTLITVLAVKCIFGEPLQIAKQGFFASGGSITEPLPGEYDEAKNWLDTTRAGNTAHIDHANVLYQIPVENDGAPIVFLHGYGQSRLGWMGTPDGRPGWSEFFLRAGHAVFLVDQPRRGEGGSSARMPGKFPDVLGEAESKDYLPGDQAWYTHFRIGRRPPERYDGSQFPEGENALNQFLRQGTPNTGDYDEALFGRALSSVLADVRKRTGCKVIYVTHSQGGRVGWATDAENVAAIVAVEPGFAPEVGSDRYRKFLDSKVPMLFLFGDYIDNGPADIQSTAFWQRVRTQCRDFAEHYRADGGDATVVDLPSIGQRGNSHFLFQEKNSDTIAVHVEAWLRERGLATSMITRKSGLEFPIGIRLPAPPFTGKAYRKDMVPFEKVFNFPQTNNITFAPGAHSKWHRHGGMVVLVTGGEGFYQAEGQPAQLLRKGDVLEIPAGTRHWHGATRDSWFSQIVIYDHTWRDKETRKEDDTLSDEYYNSLTPVEYAAHLPHSTGLMFPPSEKPLKLPTFTGEIRLSNLLNAKNVAGAPSLHYVVFEPGCYNAWHTHAGGQILIATDGVGYHQIEGKPLQVMRPGDVALCPPGVRHWHGAASGSRFAHIAAGTNPDMPGGVKWQEFLSKEEYEKLGGK